MYFTITVLTLRHPLEETMGALSDMVRQGKALYVGISNYQAEEAEAAIRILREEQKPPVCFTSRGTICSSAGRRSWPFERSGAVRAWAAYA